MNWLILLGFTFSSSLDNLGAGLTYGIRNIRIGPLSNAIIAAVCFVFSYLGIWFGQWISAVLPGMVPVLVGSFLVLVIGLRIVLLALPRKRPAPAAEPQETEPARGIAAILRHPERADLDRSNHIGIGESLLLGAALSANALTNGISAGLFGFSPLIISLAAALGSFATIGFGAWLGARAAGVRIGSFTLGQFGTLLSGLILMGIAVRSFL